MSLPWTWPPNPPAASLTSDNVTNQSNVPGANVTDALNALSAEIDGSSLNLPWIPAFNSDPTWNDEFTDGTDPDLSARGWTCENWSTGAAMTRVGDVTWHTAAGLAGNQYRSTIIGSQILIQSNVVMFIYKTMAAVDAAFAVRGRVARQDTAIGTEIKLWAYNAARNPATPERNAYGTGLIGPGNIYQFIYTNAAGVQLYNDALATGGTTAEVADIYVTDLRVPAAPAQTIWSATQQRLIRTRFGTGFAEAMTTVAAGVMVDTTQGQLGVDAAATQLGFVAIDWIRRDTSSPL